MNVMERMRTALNQNKLKRHDNSKKCVILDPFTIKNFRGRVAKTHISVDEIVVV